MAITLDTTKPERTLRERGLDFRDDSPLFEGPTYDAVDDRQDYGEIRIITIGLLANLMVVVGWNPRGADRHVFTMRKANDGEQARYTPLLAYMDVRKRRRPRGTRVGIAHQ